MDHPGKLRPLSLIIVVIATGVLAVACGDEGPGGYSIADIKQRPEARLIVPDGEVIETSENKGGTLPSFQSTYISKSVRTDLDAEAVFAYYEAELIERGWSFTRAGSPRISLLDARGTKGDFTVVLTVLNPETASSADAWNGRRTVYLYTIGAARKQGESE